MSDGPQKYELPDSSKRLIFEMMTRATLRFIVADLAAVNRTPEQAEKYVEAMKLRLDTLAAQINSGGSEVDKAWEAKMNEFTKFVFDGISFKAK